MAGRLLPPFFVATDASGNIISGGTIEFFQDGTTTPLTVYSDEGLTVSLGTSIDTNSAGYPSSDGTTPVSVYAAEKGKVVLKDSAGATVRTVDDIELLTVSDSAAFTDTQEVQIDWDTASSATYGPRLALLRDRASPGDGDALGEVSFEGDNSSGSGRQFAALRAVAETVTASNEDGELEFVTRRGGGVTVKATLADGLVIGSPTGGDPGAGGLNAETLQVGGVNVATGLTVTTYASSGQALTANSGGTLTHSLGGTPETDYVIKAYLKSTGTNASYEVGEVVELSAPSGGLIEDGSNDEHGMVYKITSTQLIWDIGDGIIYPTDTSFEGVTLNLSDWEIHFAIFRFQTS